MSTRSPAAVVLAIGNAAAEVLGEPDVDDAEFGAVTIPGSAGCKVALTATRVHKAIIMHASMRIANNTISMHFDISLALGTDETTATRNVNEGRGKPPCASPPCYWPLLHH